MRTSACAFLFSIILWPAFGQTLKYDVVRNGSSMGTTLVERKVDGNKITHHLNTSTEFRILFHFKVEYDLIETFEGEKLVSGTSWNTLNDSKQRETDLSVKDGRYSLIIDGINTVINEETITESVSEIYFDEPEHSKKVFSAYYGRYLTFEKIGEHQYQLGSPDGYNIYTYENGICTEVKISRDFATFSQVLQPEMLAAVRSKKITGSMYD